MSSVEYLKEFVSIRLNAAAEEIFGAFQKTIVEYEEELDRQRKLLDVVRKLGINVVMIEPPLQHVCKEELLADQQFFNQGRSSSLDHEESDRPKIKEEQEELCTSPERDQLVVKLETDDFMLTPADEETDHSESELDGDPQLLSNNTQTGGQHEDEGLTGDAEPEPTIRQYESESHINTVNNTNSSEIHNNSLTGKKSFKCETCGKDFEYKSILQRHKTSHTGEKLYRCKECGKSFRFNSSLYAHMSIHTGERPFSCKMCGKDFRCGGVLKSHMTTHTGEKPYTCETCGKAFSRSGYLKVHMKIHTGERPYSCKICGKDFRSVGDVRAHMRTHTGEKPYVCNVCGKRYLNASNLARHLRSHTDQEPSL